MWCKRIPRKSSQVTTCSGKCLPHFATALRPARTGKLTCVSNYSYLFAALGSATVLPAVEKIGVGWFSTISAGFLVLSALCTGAAVVWGKGWRESIDRKRRAERGMYMGDADMGTPCKALEKKEEEIVWCQSLRCHKIWARYKRYEWNIEIDW